LPFEDESFSIVVFDPPHIKTNGENSWMAKKYGKLTKDWESVIQKGFDECFRVLKKDGTLIFKWNETEIKLRQILPLSPIPPLFGNQG
jgi:23S rRNA G2069 N7-methylase RlmK/C1962 C5-methylase RlmI